MSKKSNEKIVVWGAGGHAKVVAEVLRLNGVKIAGFVDDENPVRRGREFCGAKIFTSAEQCMAGGIRQIFIAIGDNAARQQKARLARARGLRLISAAVHPRAIVAPDVTLGAGTIVMAGAVINAGSTVGENVIINTLAGIDHDCAIGNGVHISPGVRMAGKVKVGALAWIGIGASIIDDITIGERALVGAGAVIIRNVLPRAVVVGVPAHAIKHRSRR